MSEVDAPFVRWRDLDAHREAEAARRHAEIDKLAAIVAKNGDRIDALESVIDQQRGARALVWGLIGTNVLTVVALLIDFVGR